MSKLTLESDKICGGKKNEVMFSALCVEQQGEARELLIH
jgi:hypothetical protein